MTSGLAEGAIVYKLTVSLSQAKAHKIPLERAGGMQRSLVLPSLKKSVKIKENGNIYLNILLNKIVLLVFQKYLKC